MAPAPPAPPMPPPNGRVRSGTRASFAGDVPGSAVPLLDERKLVGVRAVPACRLDERPGRGGGDAAEVAAVGRVRGGDLGPLLPVVVLHEGRTAAGLAGGVGA